MVLSLVLIINVCVCSCRMGYTVEKIPGSCFHLSEEMSIRVASCVALSWNAAVTVLKYLSKGNDWILFLKVFAILCMFPRCLLLQVMHFFLVVLN
jgi:hypothetical protein